jgi:hypothetical protein
MGDYILALGYRMRDKKVKRRPVMTGVTFDRGLLIWVVGERQHYVKGMMRAIDKARNPSLIYDKRFSKTDGLRVIRSFERVNEIPFDPYNKTHLLYISRMAGHEHFFRRFKKVMQEAGLRG